MVGGGLWSREEKLQEFWWSGLGVHLELCSLLGVAVFAADPRREASCAGSIRKITFPEAACQISVAPDKTP